MDGTPTLADLPEVETGVVSEVEPARCPFVQVDDLPDEPKTDVLIELQTGERFRERLTSTPLGTNGGSPDGLNLVISNALVGADGTVEQDEAGRFRVTPPEVRHELRLTGEAMGHMGEEGVKAALLHAREVAASKHRDFFAGLAIGEKVFADRLG